MASMMQKMFNEKDRQGTSRRSKAEQIMDARTKRALDAIPEEEREKALDEAVKAVSMSLRMFETCPQCGEERLETRFYRGRRKCRNCGYREENEKMIAIVDYIDRTRGTITVGMVSEAVGLDAKTCAEYLKQLNYRMV